MHILSTTSGLIDGAAEAVDLKQTPGDIVVLSAADSEIANLARAADVLGLDGVRLANLMQLQHSYSVDLYTEQTLSHAKLIVVRLLGGKSYWDYGVDSLAALARDKGIKLAVLPGGAEQDESLAAFNTVSVLDCEHLRQYLVAGGPENAMRFLSACTGLVSGNRVLESVAEFRVAGLYSSTPSVEAAGSVGIVFYRSVIEGGLTAPIDTLCAALHAKGLSFSAIYVSSLKDKVSAAFIRDVWRDVPPDVIINATAFAVGNPQADPLATFDCPVLQVSLAGSTEADWRTSARGLNPKDLAMAVVLPEIDGRIFTRAVSFKADEQWHERTQCRVVTYKTVAGRVDYVAELTANWVRLRKVPNSGKRIAIVLANYPNKDGRIANGVGYDTPASTIAIFRVLRNQGFCVGDVPDDGNELIEKLQTVRTALKPLLPRRREPTAQVKAEPDSIDSCPRRTAALGEFLDLGLYLRLFNRLPVPVQTDITSRWGAPESDPLFHDGAFHLAILRFENVITGIQPARGYNIDPKATYHDPALVPPHGYLAFYFWIRYVFGAHAIIHNGKHGNLEWLPGKAVGLSDACYPEVALGPLPQFYPFIVNDPGEGTQAKRRTSAVIIDHLTPPLARAETYGPLKDLEALIDEYYLASGLDRRRLGALKSQIFDLTRASRLDADAGFTGDDDADLQRLDAYLCDLKEAQIRDGLHVFGQSPAGQKETDLLVALTRIDRGLGEDGDRSLIRALAGDFELGFDPLNCPFTDEWTGPRPLELLRMSGDPWRTAGDTVERLELLAAELVGGVFLPASKRAMTAQVLAKIETDIKPTLRSCGANEIASLVRALNGLAVVPGPSGAPTRGRLDVLPTGRNFFSIDNRTLPTPTAWELGRKSADALLTRHFQDTGEHLVTAAISAWGTANMRTGGDDIAQAMALMGVKPVWDTASWRVTGYDVMPLAVIGRPRVDVTLRISGFFRDAFPAQIELLDRAVAAVAALEEDAADNPLAAKVLSESEMLRASGVDEAQARALSAHRIFGSKPGAYGAGLQALIDERIWETRADLAAAFVTWGAYAYGVAANGVNSKQTFKRRLASVQAVIHNQDNREHDLLDSDDYYQFEGGLNAAVQTESGVKPRAYHNDHSRPERPVVRTLDEEIARVVRSRVVNPKWINGVKRHGYKGAFEIAATVDYMFAFAATADAVKSHHFDLAYDAYLGDADTRDFIARNNPAALIEIAARFEEAIARGLWQPRLNSVYGFLKEPQT
jgi:cobaltochelatase CobN